MARPSTEAGPLGGLAEAAEEGAERGGGSSEGR